MIESSNIERADFYRDASSASIDIFLKDCKTRISLLADTIDLGSRKLSKKEIDSVIQLLLMKKAEMLSNADFPPIYEEMLTDLISVYKERYGKRDWKHHYALSINQLMELLEKRYTFKGVRIDSVIAGNSDSNATKIEIGSEGVLFVSFSEVEEDE